MESELFRYANGTHCKDIPTSVKITIFTCINECIQQFLNYLDFIMLFKNLSQYRKNKNVEPYLFGISSHIKKMIGLDHKSVAHKSLIS